MGHKLMSPQPAPTTARGWVWESDPRATLRGIGPRKCVKVNGDPPLSVPPAAWAALRTPDTLQSSAGWSPDQLQAAEGRRQAFLASGSWGEAGGGGRAGRPHNPTTPKVSDVCKHTPHSELTVAYPGRAMLASLGFRKKTQLSREQTQAYLILLSFPLLRLTGAVCVCVLFVFVYKLRASLSTRKALGLV